MSSIGHIGELQVIDEFEKNHSDYSVILPLTTKFERI